MIDSGPAALGVGFLVLGTVVLLFPKQVVGVAGVVSSLESAPSDAALAIHRFQGAVAVALGVGILTADVVGPDIGTVLGGGVAVVLVTAALVYLLFNDDGPPRFSGT